MRSPLIAIHRTETARNQTMSSSHYFYSYSDINKEHDYTETLKGVFISTAFESNKLKCSEAYVENFLYSDAMDMQTTAARLKEINSSTMLPIKEIECNPNHLCNIKCEDYDVKVEVTNTGPYSFAQGDEVFVLPPIPNQAVDIERLRINLSPTRTFLTPITVPPFEIANITDDLLNWYKNGDERIASYSSLLFKTYRDIGRSLLELFVSGCWFVPSGYVIATCKHEPPDCKAVKISPFQKFVLKTFKPMTIPMVYQIM